MRLSSRVKAWQELALKMKLFKIILLMMFYQVHCAIFDRCRTQDVANGLERFHKDCDYAIELDKKIRNEKIKLERDQMIAIMKRLRLPHRINKLIVVCCPERKAEEACRNFGEIPTESTEIDVGHRIINGKEALVGEFPYFAALAYIIEEQLGFSCGGSLISEKFVLTAAHCCKVEEPPIIVRLGKVSF